MSDSFNRTIDYLRISVTDRCNHRCIYCMPHEGVALKGPEDILSYEQIVAIVKVAAKLGIKKVRLTGGEPLARRDIETLVAGLAKIRGIDELT
ncbi:MAG: radical SAM protein, partial [Planctomycetes bacterium]|nr:radical SAM protein [Planctomycetota bacterium]